MGNPRKNADDAYAAFMSMPHSEWLGLVMSILKGGVLEVEEQKGFERAFTERARAEQLDFDELRVTVEDYSLDEEEQQ